MVHRCLKKFETKWLIIGKRWIIFLTNAANCWIFACLLPLYKWLHVSHFSFFSCSFFLKFFVFFLFYLSVFMHSPIHWNVRLQQKYKKLRRRQVIPSSLIIITIRFDNVSFLKLIANSIFPINHQSWIHPFKHGKRWNVWSSLKSLNSIKFNCIPS